MTSSQRNCISSFMDEHVYILLAAYCVRVCVCVCVAVGAANELQGEVV